ncbi:MAG: cobalamin-dependent protein [Candidatus Lokiarchaeia archaeon]|nr:cobalamin-dependent protein [Candidatus Lokiarchaeia archaeon]
MGNKEELMEAIIDLDEDKAYNLVKKLIEDGVTPHDIIEILRKGVEVIGDKFNRKEYFLAELVMAGEIFSQSAEILEPYMKENTEPKGNLDTIVIGTVKGDVHDIGKNIFITLLKSAGYNVIDLGVDIPPNKFVEKVQETGAKVVAYSGLLTVALESMNETTSALEAAGLRQNLKIIIGGLPVDELWMKKAGADAFTDNAFEGVKIVNNWLRGGA